MITERKGERGLMGRGRGVEGRGKKLDGKSEREGRFRKRGLQFKDVCVRWTCKRECVGKRGRRGGGRMGKHQPTTASGFDKQAAS